MCLRQIMIHYWSEQRIQLQATDNSIDVYTHADYFLRIDCNKAEEELKTTSCSECALNALATDESLEYARLYLDGNMPMWVDVEDSLEVWQ